MLQSIIRPNGQMVYQVGNPHVNLLAQCVACRIFARHLCCCCHTYTHIPPPLPPPDTHISPTTPTPRLYICIHMYIYVYLCLFMFMFICNSGTKCGTLLPFKDGVLLEQCTVANCGDGEGDGGGGGGAIVGRHWITNSLPLDQSLLIYTSILPGSS